MPGSRTNPFAKGKAAAGGLDVIDVEELQEQGAGRLELPIGKILSPTWHDRKIYDKRTIEDLAHNIVATGGELIQPVIVRDEGNGQYLRVAGFRRIEAYKFLKRDTIPAIVLPKGKYTEEECMLIMMSENLQREEVNFYDQTVALLEYISLAKKMPIEEVKSLLYKVRNLKSGNSNKDEDKVRRFEQEVGFLTQKLGRISVGSLINRLAIFGYKKAVIEGIKNGCLSFAGASTINKAKTEKIAKELVTKYCNEEMGMDEVKRVVEGEKAGSRDREETLYKIEHDDDTNTTRITVPRQIPPKALKKIKKILAEL